MDALDVDALERLLPRYDLAGPRYTSYPTAPVWSEDFGAGDFAAALGRLGPREVGAGAALYVHVPFCASLCHFCACNRVITRDPERPARYLETLEREIGLVAEWLPGPLEAAQLHLGGGTPTHLEPGQLRRLVGALDAAFPRRAGAETSIEVDPRVTTREQVDALAELGFDRISLGIQDFDPRVQEAIHRVQSREQVAELVEHCRKRGFRSVNFDLIYGLPYQTTASFDATLDHVLQLAPDRVALYSYAHVTWVAKQQRGFERHDLPAGAEKLAVLLLALRRFGAAGYRAIGMDHFARPDDDLSHALEDGRLQRNFMGYTTAAGGALLAFGPSGISELPDAFAQSQRELGAWHEAVDAGRLATLRGHLRSDEDLRRGWVIEELMCRGRVAPGDYSKRFDREFPADFAAERERLAPLAADGLVTLAADGGVAVTPVGRLLVRNVAMTFDAYLPEQQRHAGPLFSRTI